MKPSKTKVTLEDFLSWVEEMNTDITNITENTDKLKAIQRKILIEFTQQERKRLISTQNDLIRDNKVIGRKIQMQIEEEQQKLNKQTIYTTCHNDFDIRGTQIQSLEKRFLAIWNEYNNSQIKFREKNKEVLLGHLKIIDPNCNFTNEEIEEKLNAGEVTGSGLSIIQERAETKEIMKLKKGMIGIHDLSNMVNLQGEAVDRIEVRLGDVEMPVQEGRKQLEQAKKIQKAIIKKKSVVIGMVIVFSLVALIILAFTVF